MHCYLPYPCYTIWPPTSELFGHALGLALWGLYVCLFFLTIWRLRATRSKYTPALTGIIVLFVLNLIQTVLSMMMLYDLFITHAENTMLAMLVVDNFAPVSAAQDVVFLLSSLTESCILWWRLYVIWTRDRRVLLVPIVGLIVSLGGGIYLVALDIIRCLRPATLAELKAYTRWTRGVLSSDLAITWLATLMIIWKLYRVGQKSMQMTDRKSNKYLKIILALVESGILYSVVLGVFVALWFASLQSVSILLNASLPRVIGIVPLLIMLKLSLGYEEPADHPSPHIPHARQVPIIRRARRDSLSIDVSSAVPSQAQDVEEKADREVPKTIGGADVARDVDLEAGRPKSTEF